MNTFPVYSKKELDNIKKESIVSLVVDSEFRDRSIETSISDFTIQLPVPIHNVIRMKLSSLELPNSSYLFHSENNTFKIKLTHTEDYSINYEKTITIPEGNYTIEELKVKINSIFNSLVNEGALQDSLFSIMKFDYSKEKHKCYFCIKSMNEISLLYSDVNQVPSYELEKYLVSLYFSTETNVCKKENNLKEIFGYSENQYENKTGNLDAENIFNMKSTPYYLLYVDEYSKIGRESMITSFNKRNTDLKYILARIVTKNENFDYTILDTSDDNDKQRDYTGPANIEKLHIKLLDKWGNLVNLNNCNYSFILEFTTIR